VKKKTEEAFYTNEQNFLFIELLIRRHSVAVAIVVSSLAVAFAGVVLRSCIGFVNLHRFASELWNSVVQLFIVLFFFSFNFKAPLVCLPSNTPYLPTKKYRSFHAPLTTLREGKHQQRSNSKKECNIDV